MAALSAVGSTLAQPAMAPLSLDTGATSESRPNPEPEQQRVLAPITTADRAGAAILTILACVGFVGAMVWIVLE
jgi:mannan endo-1,6-alpha-mannosidase